MAVGENAVMGTNFYYVPSTPQCGDEIHIGKSSIGWCFALHVTDELPNLTKWRELWERGVGQIVDEYGDHLTTTDMLRRITHRFFEHGKDGRSKKWYEDNYACDGPFGLARFKIDNERCVGHGNGTWDEIRGDFS